MENIRIKSERAILFADVCDSTSLMEALGDEQGRELIAEILAELERVSEPLRGVVVKTIGDEILLAFDSPMDAIAAAVGMQRSMQMRRTVTGTPLAIRVGLHYGSVLTEAKDVFGDVVNVAARVVAKATARQVLTTADTLDPVTDVVPYRSLGAHRLKGRAGHLHLYEILWRGDTSALTALTPKLAEAQTHELHLRLEDEEISLSPDATNALMIGRGVENDLRVPGIGASRSHARITVRGGRFYLADHSTNGTYVLSDGGSEIHVHRDEVLLQGAGRIRLSGSFSDPAARDIEYRIW